MARKRSKWIAFVEMFLLWIGGRSIFNVVLYEVDPNYRVAATMGLGGALVTAEALFGCLAIGAAVAIYLRYRHALMMATGTLALYTGLTIVGIRMTAADLPAAREAFKASREARGLPISDERLDEMFTPAMIPTLWGVAALLCIPPYAILLWRKHELVPPEDDE